MYFERIVSEWLSHYSYFLADGQQAVVIDPRRDCEIYQETAARQGVRVSYILETHRNEDYVSGAAELARRTGALVLRSAYSKLDYHYGRPVYEGESIQVGRLRLEAFHTPGHTLGHMGYLLYDPQGAPWMFFSGDALFAGDVGRTDFYGAGRLEETTSNLHETIFKKILPLGDEIILCPAHGPGSVCGSSIAERTWTTLGLERKHNRKLQYTNKADFVKNVGQLLEIPPYFEQVERLNLEGPSLPQGFPYPRVLSAQEFKEAAGDAQIIDLRDELAFSTAHIEGSLMLWQKLLSFYAGWFLDFERSILIVSDGPVEQAVRQLARLGYDRVAGVLSGGIKAWLEAGFPVSSLQTIPVEKFCELFHKKEIGYLLDIRSAGDIQKQGNLLAEGYKKLDIPLTELPQRLQEIPSDVPFYILCGTGSRSVTAASLLKKYGLGNVRVILGGFLGILANGC